MNKEQADYVKIHYPYVNIQAIDPSIITEYLNRPYIVGRPLAQQMDCLYDYILSNNLTDIEE